MSGSRSHWFTERANAQVIQALFKELDDYQAEAIPTHFVTRAKSRRKPDILAWLGDRDKVLLLAEFNVKVVGLANGRQVGWSPDYFVKKVKTLKIESVAVKNEFRKDGVGDALIKGIEDYAKSKKFKRLYLEVFSRDENARRLLEGNRYKTVSMKFEKEIG